MNITVIAITATLGLIGLSILVSIFAGIKSVINGKQDFKKIITILIPAVVFAITYGVMGTAGDAGIATMLVMLALMAVVTLISGLKSTLNF